MDPSATVHLDVWQFVLAILGTLGTLGIGMFTIYLKIEGRNSAARKDIYREIKERDIAFGAKLENIAQAVNANRAEVLAGYVSMNHLTEVEQRVTKGTDTIRHELHDFRNEMGKTLGELVKAVNDRNVRVRPNGN